jgi:hypothetical protein
MTVAELSIARTILCERIPHPQKGLEGVWGYVADGLTWALGVRPRAIVFAARGSPA